MSQEPAVPRLPALLWFALLLLIAAGLQSTTAGAVNFRGGHPDIILTIGLSAALLSDAGVGCLTGLAAGMVTTSLIGKTLGTFLISRTIAGYIAGGITRRLYRGNAGVILLGVFVGSLIAEVIYGLSVPRLGLFHWLQSVPISAAMNALLALPMTYLLRRVGWGQGRL